MAEGPPLLVPGIESEKVHEVVVGEQISFCLEDILDKSSEKRKEKIGYLSLFFIIFSFYYIIIL